MVMRGKPMQGWLRVDPDHLCIDNVAVVFADMVGFTEQAGRIPPTELVATLDDLFARFDAIADRFGLEKIKTVGDEYMAVAGAPEPTADTAVAAAENGARDRG